MRKKGRESVSPFECNNVFSLGFGQGSQQLLGDPFPGIRKPMSPVAAQVRFKCFLLNVYSSVFLVFQSLEQSCFCNMQIFICYVCSSEPQACGCRV